MPCLLQDGYYQISGIHIKNYHFFEESSRFYVSFHAYFYRVWHYLPIRDI